MADNLELSYPDPLDNPSQRTPCLLVLDASESMDEKGPGGLTRMQQLNEGLATFEKELKGDEKAKTHVQVAVVSVGTPADCAALMQDWTDAYAFEALTMTAGGRTPLGAGLLKALEVIESQKQVYKAAGIDYTRPWMMVITDGQPTDDAATWQKAVSACRAAENDKKCVIYPIGVEGADVAKLQEITRTRVLMLKGVNFKPLFVWLSKSMERISSSAEGAPTQLPSTNDWAVFPS